MLFQILFYCFFIISFIDIVHLCLYLVGANYYDYKQLIRRKTPIKYGRTRPLVTVLIPAHNEEKSITRCLESVRKSRLRKLEIIVVDDGSTDNTKRLVSQYIKLHPNRNIRLMYKQKNVGKGAALNHGLRHGAKGSFVMMLDADSIIHPLAISNAVRYFDDPKIVGVAANVRILDDLSILWLLQKFEYLISYRSKKFFTVINSEYIVGGVACTYRMDTLKKVGYYDDDSLTEDIGLSLKIVSQGNKDTRVVYGADVVAMTEPVQSFKTLVRQRYRWKMGSLQSLTKYRSLFANTDKKYSFGLSWYRIPMAFLGEVLLLLEPLAIAFVVYISITIGKPTFVIGAYMTITLYILWNLWPDEHMSLKNKIKFTSLSVFMYPVFYIMNVVQLVGLARCIYNNKMIIRRTNQKTSWVSPERGGQTQAQFN